MTLKAPCTCRKTLRRQKGAGGRESKSSFEPVPKAVEVHLRSMRNGFGIHKHERERTHTAAARQHGAARQPQGTSRPQRTGQQSTSRQAGKQAGRWIPRLGRMLKVLKRLCPLFFKKVPKSTRAKTGNPVHALPCLTIGGYWAKPSETKATPTASRRDIEHKVFKAKAVLVQSGSVVASCAEAGPVQ